MKRALLFAFIFNFQQALFSQNVGLGVSNPQGRFHIKGADNISELLIDADTNQTNQNPMIRLRKSDGTDLMRIHADNIYNIFNKASHRNSTGERS